MCMEKRDSSRKLPSDLICSWEKTGGIDTANLRGVCMEDIAAVEDIVQAGIFFYDVGTVDGSLIAVIATRSVVKISNAVRPLRCESHICYVSNVDSLFKAYQCPSCGQFIKRAHNLEGHLITYRERVKHGIPNKLYQLRETLFDKLDSFNIPYSDDYKLFKNMALCHFELICVLEDKLRICVLEDKLRDSDTTTCIGKHVPISYNLFEQPIIFFLCNSNPRTLVESFVDALDGLVTQSIAEMNLKKWRLRLVCRVN